MIYKSLNDLGKSINDFAHMSLNDFDKSLNDFSM